MLDRSLEPRPSDVEGFAEARATGMTPAVAAQPPASPLTVPTAHTMLRRLGYSLAVTVGAAVAALVALPKPDGRIAPVTAMVIIVVLACGGFLIRRESASSGPDTNGRSSFRTAL